MSTESNIAVFNHTKELYQQHPALRSSLEASVRAQKFIPGDASVECEKQKYTNAAETLVSGKRSFEAARAYPGRKVCVLNFASYVNPGGGVTHGAAAQEECLCRISTLYGALTAPRMISSFYLPHRAERNPLAGDDCIYTPDVTVFKSDTASPELLPEEEWYKVNVITCAAPNLRHRERNMVRVKDQEVFFNDTDLKNLHIRRMQRILSVAAAGGNEVMILGAFGCGAFMNPPSVVARALKRAAEEFRNTFETIEFAVYTTPASARNYDVFRQIFR